MALPITADVQPPAKREGNRIYPFPTMAVGDSFWAQNALSAQMSAGKWKRTHPGWDYRSRTERQGAIRGVRVWRVA